MNRRSIKALTNQERGIGTSNRAIKNGISDIAHVEVKGDLRRNGAPLLYHRALKYVDKYVEKKEVDWKRPFRHPLVSLIGVVLLLITLTLGVRYYLYSRAHEWTDDAFISGDVTQIAPQVAGQILKVHIRDNQEVKQGDLLVEIDPRAFEARLAEAQAALKEAEAEHRAAQATSEQTQTTAQSSVEETSSGVNAALAALQTARA